MVLGNSLHRSLDRTGDTQSRTLGSGARPPVASTESDRSRHLLDQEIDLGFDFSRAFMIASIAQIFEFFPQFEEAAPIILLCPGIKHLSRIAGSADADAAGERKVVSICVLGARYSAGAAEKIERVKLFSRMLQQALNVAEAFDVLQRKRGPLVADGPIFATSSEGCHLHRWSTARPESALTIGGNPRNLCHCCPQIDAARTRLLLTSFAVPKAD